ncbi:resolvase [Rhodococcus opacus RKJ300 = JCM 13270]|uniref:Resolvase n=1 Tax=Rhodococcus opacus RKJ300 = JCM 13270 TaxID=1165867 RepID=I0WTZ1_RHOOP|nr:resolvase [Rhodococcus opacus RKJ300 = JCM 13270]
MVTHTREGVTAARARGRTGGRPPKLGPDQIRLARRLHEDGHHTVAQIAALLNVPRTTIYGYLTKKSASTAEHSTRQEVPPAVVERSSRACPTCGHEPVSRAVAAHQRADLAVTWLHPDPCRPRNACHPTPLPPLRTRSPGVRHRVLGLRRRPDPDRRSGRSRRMAHPAAVLSDIRPRTGIPRVAGGHRVWMTGLQAGAHTTRYAERVRSPGRAGHDTGCRSRRPRRRDHLRIVHALGPGAAPLACTAPHPRRPGRGRGPSPDRVRRRHVPRERGPSPDRAGAGRRSHVRAGRHDHPVAVAQMRPHRTHRGGNRADERSVPRRGVSSCAGAPFVLEVASLTHLYPVGETRKALWPRNQRHGLTVDDDQLTPALTMPDRPSTRRDTRRCRSPPCPARAVHSGAADRARRGDREREPPGTAQPVTGHPPVRVLGGRSLRRSEH